jgi:hypothetical protein
MIPITIEDNRNRKSKKIQVHTVPRIGDIVVVNEEGYNIFYSIVVEVKHSINMTNGTQDIIVNVK